MQARTLLHTLGRWTAITAPLHLVWEILHVRLYTLWWEERPATIVYGILHCTAGDVLIAGAAFLAAAAVTRRLDWPTQAWRTGLPVLLAVGIGYTAVSEWVNVYRLGRWAYTSDMPLIAGLGLSPLLQWVLVPLLGWAGYRRLGSRRTE